MAKKNGDNERPSSSIEKGGRGKEEEEEKDSSHLAEPIENAQFLDFQSLMSS